MPRRQSSYITISSLREQIKQRISRPLYRNSLFLIANTVVTSGLGFFFWMIVARFYTEAEVGLGAAIISAMTFFALFGKLGFNTALIRFLPKAERPVEMINSCFTLSGIAALVGAAVFVAGLDIWSPALSFIKHNAVFIMAFILFAVCWTLSGMTESVFIARRRAEFVMYKNVIISLIKLPLPILMVVIFRAFGIISSWGIAVGIALAISLLLFMPRVQSRYKPVPRLDLGLIRNIGRYSAGNYFAGLFSAATHMVLPILIVNILGATQNAYFYVAWMIAGVLQTIPLAVSSSLFAEGSHFEDELRVHVRKSFKLTFLLLIPACLVVIVLGKWLLLLFGGSYSANALTLLWLLSISSLLAGVSSIYMTILRVKSRIRELVIIAGLSTIAVLLGTYLVAPTTGIIGIGYVWLAVQGLISIYALLRMGWVYHTVRV